MKKVGHDSLMKDQLQQQDKDQLAVYVARTDFEYQLHTELNSIIARAGDLIIARTQTQLPVFAKDIWYQPRLMTIDSIGDAVKQLKAIQPFWYSHPVNYARRCKLIEQQLPRYRHLTPHQFPLQKLPSIGGFCLLDKNTLLYATQRDKPVPDGEFKFDEDKTHPPNRAYLKLWEALCLLGRYPQQGDNAIDLGASPGGWSYVLQSCGAQVQAYDKAKLDPTIAQLPGIQSYQQSAFALSPKDFNSIDWLVSDIACYPQRLYRWLQPWLASNQVKQYILTLKLQGQTDFEAIQPFQQIPNSRTLQLAQNKHEVTWLYPFIAN